MKVELNIEVDCVEDGYELPHNTHAIIQKLLCDSVLRQLQTIKESEIYIEQGYRAALVELLEHHKQVN